MIIKYFESNNEYVNVIDMNYFNTISKWKLLIYIQQLQK